MDWFASGKFRDELGYLEFSFGGYCEAHLGRLFFASHNDIITYKGENRKGERESKDSKDSNPVKAVKTVKTVKAVKAVKTVKTVKAVKIEIGKLERGSAKFLRFYSGQEIALLQVWGSRTNGTDGGIGWQEGKRSDEETESKNK